MAARWAHNPKVGGSSPPPATQGGQLIRVVRLFCCRQANGGRPLRGRNLIAVCTAVQMSRQVLGGRRAREGLGASAGPRCVLFACATHAGDSALVLALTLALGAGAPFLFSVLRSRSPFPFSVPVLRSRSSLRSRPTVQRWRELWRAGCRCGGWTARKKSV